MAGPGDCVYRQNRSSAFLSHAKSQNTLPDVFVWHELGKESLSSFRSHYESYRKLEKKYGINPIDVNITEYGELRDMSVPGQLIQWQSMFEDEKVQAERHIGIMQATCPTTWLEPIPLTQGGGSSMVW